MKTKSITIKDVQKAIIEIVATLPKDSIIIEFEVSISTTKKSKNKITFDNQTIISTSSVRRKTNVDLSKTFTTN